MSDQMDEAQLDEGKGKQTDESSKGAVNLDELDEFRNWKSKMDQKIAAMAAQAQAAEDRAATLEQRLAVQRDAEMQDAPPEQRAEYYEKRLKELRAQQEAQSRQQQEAARLQRKAAALLDKHGISWEHPGLDRSGGATVEGFEALITSAMDIVAERAKGRLTPEQQQIQEKRQKAKEKIETGGGRQSKDKGGPGAEAHTAFVEGYRRFRHTGDMMGYSRWKHQQMRKHGAEAVNKWLEELNA